MTAALVSLPAGKLVASAHDMPFGAALQADGAVAFRLWAPAATSVFLEVEGVCTFPLAREDDGWHRLTVRIAAGSRYRFRLPDGLLVPDPASRRQPLDANGPSEVVDPSLFRWTDTGWRGRPWTEAVIYELHVGTFTPAGTFRAVIERLDHLVALGVTAIELMPIAEFGGAHNWGYDGVLPYAPESAYGHPDDLRALVDAAHARGLMVFLDVVYNHFGPEGNYLAAYAPAFFTDRHKTPWGDAINLDGADSRPVREFIVHNALYWLEEFHLDGLRLDAVHTLIDDGPEHLLVELARRVRAFAGDRHVHLMLENEENDAALLARPAGRTEHFTAQWNDDVHHVLHTAISGETGAYYADYAGDDEKLGRALAEGFAFQGELMAYRGSPRGTSSGHLPPTAFIAFLQNHDQVGNRAFGDRIGASVPQERVRAAAAVYLLLPQIPMLFMGEEWGAREPFPFFVDFGGDLADAVRAGRRKEFARFPEFSDAAARERIPDPTAPETLASARLDWSALADESHTGQLDWYRRVLAVRHAEIVPRLPRAGHGGKAEAIGRAAVAVSWDLGGETLGLLANLSDRPVAAAIAGRVIWTEGAVVNGTLAPWTVVWSLLQA